MKTLDIDYYCDGYESLASSKKAYKFQHKTELAELGVDSSVTFGFVYFRDAIWFRVPE